MLTEWTSSSMLCYVAQGGGNADEGSSLGTQTDTKMDCTKRNNSLSKLRPMPQLLVMQTEIQVCPIMVLTAAWQRGRSTVPSTNTGLRTVMLPKVGKRVVETFSWP